MALTRIVELPTEEKNIDGKKIEVPKGQIFIDGEDIAKLDL